MSGIKKEMVKWDKGKPIDPKMVKWDAEQKTKSLSQRAIDTVVGDDPLRQIALGSRAIAKGALLPVNMVMDLPMQIRNWALGEHNRLPSQYLDESLTALGAPTPEGKQEAIISAVNEGGAGALSIGSGGLGPIPKALQTARSGVIGGGASEYAKQEGAPWWLQTLAGVVTPMAFDVANVGSRMIYNAVAPPKLGGVSPYSQGGRELAAGNVLARNTAAPGAVVQRLEQDPTIVGGVVPRTAEIADDPRLAQLDKLLQNTRPDYRSSVVAAEGANNRVLRNVITGAVPEQVVKSADIAAKTTTAARNAALASADDVGKEAVNKIVSMLDELADSKLAIADANVRPALAQVRKQLYDSNGKLITDPDRLDAVRQYVSNMIAGNFDAPGAQYSKANKVLHGVLEKIKSTVDTKMGDPAYPKFPGYSESLRRTSEAMKPIEQSRLMSQLLEKASSKADILPGGAGAGGENYKIILSKLNSALSNERMASKVDRVLTDEQLDVVSKVVKELERGAKLTSMQRNRLGSDTFQNLSSAALFGRVLGIDLPPSAVAKAPDYIQKTMGWIANLGGGPQEKILSLVDEAMQNPRLAAELLKKAPAANLETFSEAFARKGREYASGGVIGGQKDY